MPHASHPDVERYADALIALGEASGTIHKMEEDLHNLAGFIEQQEELRRFLASSHVREEGKVHALRAILRDHLCSELIFFTEALLVTGHLQALPRIADAFLVKRSNQREQQIGEILTAVPLSETKHQDIEDAVGRILDKSVTLRPRVVPDMLGGVFVKVGDFIIDGTIDTQLDAARRALTAE